MFHELLCALKGLPGNIFFDSSDGIKVSSSIPNFHPSEHVILIELCDLATQYKSICDFIKKYKFHRLALKNEVHGCYLQALCTIMDSVLSSYREELFQMEQEILKDQFLTLSYFLKLDKYKSLFQVLTDMIEEIVQEKVHGCRILDILFKYSITGNPLVETPMNKMLQYCHTVMYRQLYHWIMNASLEDPFNEFFIQAEKSTKDKQTSVSSSKETTKSVKFSVKPELLPSYIPSTLAVKIYSVGIDVSALREAEDSESYSLFLTKERMFSKRIEKLSLMPSFSLLRFIAVIDEIGKFASELLLQVIVKKANIQQHLSIMKDFYLLGRGELFLNFITEAKLLLRMPVTTCAESEVSKLFLSATRNAYPDDDVNTEKFHVTLHAFNKGAVVDKESLSKAKLETGWSSITLFYDVPNPLHMLITPSVIDKYNVIFRFLLSVRRVQIELHQCWALQMQLKGTGSDARLVPFWNLRSHMSFLVDNFQYYILVDVLESCFSHISEKIKKVTDFEDVQNSHNEFLSHIVSQCFLELWTVNHSISEILEICSSYCSLLQKVNFMISQKEMNQFESLKLNFQRQTSLLFRLLSGVRSHQVSPYLSQLLLRLDFNNFLSSCGGQLGGIK